MSLGGKGLCRPQVDLDLCSFVPGRMPALFHSVTGVLCNRFHPWFTQSVYAGHTGKGQKVGEYGRLHCIDRGFRQL